MRISSKTIYGVRALIHLALHAEQAPILSREIAQGQQIPETYLHQLVLQLRRAGLITSVRGPRGGHMLALPPAEITVLQIFEALEGPLVVVAESTIDTGQTGVDRVLSGVWDDLRTVMRAELTQTTLADLRDRLHTDAGQLMYEI